MANHTLARTSAAEPSAAGDQPLTTKVLTNPPALMTAEQLIQYLQLDQERGDARERLRNLIRRQRLPVVRRGRLQRFRLADVEAWLDGGAKGGRKIIHPARLQTNSKVSK